MTVFAPTNQAFDNKSAVVAGLTAAEVETALNYHVITGDVDFTAIAAITGTAPDLVAKVAASNGTVFVISEVLVA